MTSAYDDDGHTDPSNSLGLLLAGQSGRAAAAEAAYREAIAAGNPRAPVNLAILLAQLGREDEAEQLGRAARCGRDPRRDEPRRPARTPTGPRERSRAALARCAGRAPRSDHELQFVALTLGDLH